MAEETTALDYQKEDRLHEAIASFEQARDAGAVPDPRQWLERYPEVAGRLAEYFADQNELRRRLGDARPDSRLGQAPPLERAPQVPDYEIVEQIGHGGMGVVYKARQVSAKRIVALKVIRADRLEQPSAEERRKAVERFVTEAQAAARLEHDNIVSVYEVGEVGGRPFYSMRFVDGSSLHDLVKPGPLESRRAAAYMAAVARAVHEAHRHGILHRDLKPHNILVEARDDRPLVADFGLAKLLQGGPHITRSGDVMGTPPYISPEQAQGSASLTVATDVYGLGATLYVLLTGRPPFQADEPVQTLRRVVEDEPAPPRTLNPHVDRDLETICLKCLEKEPRKRYASAAEVADRLQLFLEGKPIPDRPITRAERLWRWVRRHPARAALAALSCFTVLAVLGILAGLYANTQLTDLNDRLQEALQGEQDQRMEADRQRQRAHEIEVRSARALYMSRLQFANQAWKDRRPEWAIALLENYRSPPAGEEDLRGFEWYYLWQACHGDQLTLRGHHNGIVSIAYSPDGRYLASAGGDSVVILWDAATGKELRTLRGHNQALRGVAFSPDGILLASADGSGEVVLWECATGLKRCSWKVKEGVLSIAYSPSGKHLALTDSDTHVQLCDISNGKQVLAREGDGSYLSSVAFSRDGNYLAAVSENGLIKVWRTSDGRELYTFQVNGGSPGHGLAFSPDNKRLASVDNGSKPEAGARLRVWDLVSGRELLSFPTGNHDLKCVVFSPDGRLLATGGEVRAVQLWEAGSGHAIRAFHGHKAGIASIVFGPDGRSLVSAGANPFLSGHPGEIKIWRLDPAPEPLTLKCKGYKHTLALSPDGKHVASLAAGPLPNVVAWDAHSGRPVQIYTGAAGQIYDVAFSPDGDWLAAAGDGAWVWDTATGKQILALPEAECGGAALRVAFSPDNRKLAFGCRNGEMHVWEIQGKKRIHQFNPHSGGHRDYCCTVVFSPDGRYLAGSGELGTVTIWDLHSGQLCQRFACFDEGFRDSVYTVAYSPDGRSLACASGEWESTGTTTVCDTLTGKQLFSSTPARACYTVAYSSDGQRLITADVDGSVRVLDAASGVELLSLQEFKETCCAVLSRDGRRLAAYGSEGVIKIWDVAMP